MYFAIGAIFKNEAHIMKEWLNHYFFHGVDHIYLINDNSSDNFMDILTPFLNKKLVTLYDGNDYKGKTSWGEPFPEKFVGMQWRKYNFFFTEHFKKYKWFGTFDLDEFLYSPKCINIKEILKLLENEKQISMNWVNFGSNGFIKQPENVVDNFICRAKHFLLPEVKSIIRTDYGNVKNVELRIHTHTVGWTDQTRRRAHIPRSYNASRCQGGALLLVNHYQIQSKDFWTKIKMTRGDADYWFNHINKKRDLKLFEKLDINDIEDNILKNQNKNIVAID
jgi:hypothetical protein